MSIFSKEFKNFIRDKEKIKKVAYSTNEEGNAVINVGAEKFDDIFSPFCYKGGDSLRADLVDYIEEKADCVPINTELEICFRVKDASDAKLAEITDAFDRNYKTEIKLYQAQLKKNNLFSLFMLLFGLGFFSIYVLTMNLVPLAVALIFEIGTWVFIWEALDSYFLERRMIRLQILKRYRLLYASKKIKEFEIY